MFRKVKAKFIAISTLITAIILIFISGGIYFSIKGQTNRNNNQILEMIVAHQSNFKFWDQQGWGDQQQGWGDQQAWEGSEYSNPYTSESQPETPHDNSSLDENQRPEDRRDRKEQPPETAQYFTVVYADSMFRTDDLYSMEHITSINEEEAKEIIEEIKTLSGRLSNVWFVLVALSTTLSTGVVPFISVTVISAPSGQPCPPAAFVHSFST